MLAGAALVLSAGLAVAIAGGFLIDLSSPSARLGLLAASIVLAAGSAALAVHRFRENHRVAERHLEALCQIDACNLNVDGPQDPPPPLPAGNSWSRIAGRVRELLLECSRRTRELKHTRTAWEVRCRRASARYEQLKGALFEESMHDSQWPDRDQLETRIEALRQERDEQLAGLLSEEQLERYRSEHSHRRRGHGR